MQRVINVIDIGSRNICALIGRKGINNSLNVKIFTSEQYDGYSNGEFFCLSNLKMAISEAVNRIETTTKRPFIRSFVGIPAEFCVIKSATAQLTFDRPKLITDSVISELCDIALGSIQHTLNNLTLINRAPISFVTEAGKKVTSAKGLRARVISAHLSFAFIKKDLKADLTKILKAVGLIDVDFVCTPLAQAMYLLNPEIRKADNILIDVGYISTSVAWTSGEGICQLFAFSLGGGHISGDLCECLKIRYRDAETLKSSIILSVDKSESDVYNIDSGIKTLPISAKAAHDICKARIEDIAKNVSIAINSFNKNFPKTQEVFLAGEGILSVTGGKDYLSKCLGRPVIAVTASSPMPGETKHSSILSILNFAIIVSELDKKRWW